MSKVTHESLSKTIAANVYNENLSDSEFRNFVLRNLGAEVGLLDDQDFRALFEQMFSRSSEHSLVMSTKGRSLVVITVDFVAEGHVSHMEVAERIKAGDSRIITSSIKAFCFDKLKKNVDVIALYRDGRYMMVSDMLNNPFKYCDKKLVMAHNLSKMFLEAKLASQPACVESIALVEQLQIISEPQVSKPEYSPTIEITVDFVNESTLAYEPSLAAIAEMRSFSTANLHFFDFAYLDMGYSVVAKTKSGGTCDLSSFLSNSKPYIDKEIRRSHTAWKFLISNGIRFL